MAKATYQPPTSLRPGRYWCWSSTHRREVLLLSLAPLETFPALRAAAGTRMRCHSLSISETPSNSLPLFLPISSSLLATLGCEVRAHLCIPSGWRRIQTVICHGAYPLMVRRKHTCGPTSAPTGSDSAGIASERIMRQYRHGITIRRSRSISWIWVWFTRATLRPGSMSEAAKLELGFDLNYGITHALPPIHGERK